MGRIIEPPLQKKNVSAKLQTKMQELMRSVAEKRRQAEAKERNTILAKNCILDLIRLRYNFQAILDCTGVDKGFLTELYKSLNFPINVKTASISPSFHSPSDIALADCNSAQEFNHTNNNHQNDTSSCYSDSKTPRWLNNLVIDLTSSDSEAECSSDNRIELRCPDSISDFYNGTSSTDIASDVQEDTSRGDDTAKNILSEISHVLVKSKIELNRIKTLYKLKNSTVPSHLYPQLLRQKNQFISHVNSVFHELGILVQDNETESSVRRPSKRLRNADETANDELPASKFQVRNSNVTTNKTVITPRTSTPTIMEDNGSDITNMNLDRRETLAQRTPSSSSISTISADFEPSESGIPSSSISRSRNDLTNKLESSQESMYEKAIITKDSKAKVFTQYQSLRPFESNTDPKTTSEEVICPKEILEGSCQDSKCPFTHIS
ncbi:HEL090Wp [Eremothecium sinecaudum]|uniref:HEL090Wp n=1 Tax=Eremothecium sinecaudum TaxID=45286 RepID=A0A0X8HTH4_9SACH|nr:HEL090Wp [Eremothecium sinecaudum]AMD21190.1 HEL090Wp [Eremothecium sinecaudum]